jgi:hypothetical protein
LTPDSQGIPRPSSFATVPHSQVSIALRFGGDHARLPRRLAPSLLQNLDRFLPEVQVEMHSKLAFSSKEIATCLAADPTRQTALVRPLRGTEGAAPTSLSRAVGTGWHRQRQLCPPNTQRRQGSCVTSHFQGAVSTRSLEKPGFRRKQLIRTD